MSEQVDRAGAVASTLCAAHCAVSALLPAALGALGVGFLLGHTAEWVFTLIAVAFGAAALFLGMRRHRSLLVAVLLIAGMVGLLGSRALEGSAGHHGDQHAAGAEQAKPHGEGTEHRSEHGSEHGAHREERHEDHDGVLHAAGTVMGVFAGLLLMLGHLLNIRVGRGFGAKPRA